MEIKQYKKLKQIEFNVHFIFIAFYYTNIFTIILSLAPKRH